MQLFLRRSWFFLAVALVLVYAGSSYFLLRSLGSLGWGWIAVLAPALLVAGCIFALPSWLLQRNNPAILPVAANGATPADEPPRVPPSARYVLSAAALVLLAASSLFGQFDDLLQRLHRPGEVAYGIAAATSPFVSPQRRSAMICEATATWSRFTRPQQVAAPSPGCADLISAVAVPHNDNAASFFAHADTPLAVLGWQLLVDTVLLTPSFAAVLLILIAFGRRELHCQRSFIDQTAQKRDKNWRHKLYQQGNAPGQAAQEANASTVTRRALNGGALAVWCILWALVADWIENGLVLLLVQQVWSGTGLWLFPSFSLLPPGPTALSVATWAKVGGYTVGALYLAAIWLLLVQHGYSKSRTWVAPGWMREAIVRVRVQILVVVAFGLGLLHEQVTDVIRRWMDNYFVASLGVGLTIILGLILWATARWMLYIRYEAKRSGAQPAGSIAALPQATVNLVAAIILIVAMVGLPVWSPSLKLLVPFGMALGVVLIGQLFFKGWEVPAPERQGWGEQVMPDLLAGAPLALLGIALLQAFGGLALYSHLQGEALAQFIPITIITGLLFAGALGAQFLSPLSRRIEGPAAHKRRIFRPEEQPWLLEGQIEPAPLALFVCAVLWWLTVAVCSWLASPPEARSAAPTRALPWIATLGLALLALLLAWWLVGGFTGWIAGRAGDGKWGRRLKSGAKWLSSGRAALIRGAWGAGIAVVTIGAGLLLVLLAGPQLEARLPDGAAAIGAVATIALALILFLLTGTSLILTVERITGELPPLFRGLGLRRIPVLTLLIIWGAIAGGLPPRERLHDVLTPGQQRAASTVPLEGENLEAAFDTWRCLNGALRERELATVHRVIPCRPAPTEPAPGSSKPLVPLVLLATAGGGIRAAVWTTYVLDHTFGYDTGASAARFDGVFAASGVSGGSLGLASFVAQLTGPEPRQDQLNIDGAGDPSQSWIYQRLGRDNISAPISWMLFVEAPWALLHFDADIDRARILEQTWEQPWPEPGLQQLFLGLRGNRYTPPSVAPLLIFNGTSVESGCRFNTSPLEAHAREAGDPAARCLFLPNIPRIGQGTLAATVDLVDFLCIGQDITLSQAALLSARFPLISPSGHIQQCQRNGVIYRPETYIVDGGYLENSGAGTAVEIWTALEELVEAHNLSDQAAYIVPFFIQIENGYDEPASPGAVISQSQLTVPVAALAAAAQSHQVLARQSAQLIFSKPFLVPEPGSPTGKAVMVGDGSTSGCRRYARFALLAHPGPRAPLAWTLARESFRDLERQLGDGENELARAQVQEWFQSLSLAEADAC